MDYNQNPSDNDSNESNESTDVNDSNPSDKEDNKSNASLSELFSDKDKRHHILIEYSKQDNIVDDLDEEDVADLAMSVIAGYEADKSSQAEWLQSVEDSLKLAKLTKEPKNTPLPQSANIKIPLITDACYQYAARTYPEIIQDGKIVKIDVVGLDLDPIVEKAAQEGATYMNYQLLGPDSEWEESHDRLLILCANIGFVCKKTYYDSQLKKIVSDLVPYKDLILRNDSTIQGMTSLRRITHVLHCHPNDMIENARYGIYCEDTVKEIMAYYSFGKKEEEKKATSTLNPECTLLEQHCFADLDKDGYEEPYIITIHKETHKIVRIKARYEESDIEFKDKEDDSEEDIVKCITPIQYFTAYHFLPSPDGSFMGLGFGTLLLHLNETCNTILNQEIDAGKLANMQTGFIDARLKIPGGEIRVDPGQWNKVKGVTGTALKDGIFPVTYKEPSSVLYQLLGMLMETCKELTSSTDAMQGLGNATNVPATTQLSMIEQGMKRFSAIHKRHYRSLKEEFQKIWRLNKTYSDPIDFAAIVKDKTITPKDVFDNKSLKVFPIADPNLSSDAQRMAQAQVVMSLAALPNPSGINLAECYMRLLNASKVSHPEQIVNVQAVQQAQQQAQSRPDPKMLKVQSDAQNHQQQNQIKMQQHALKEKEFVAKLPKTDAEITKIQAEAVKSVAEAHSIQHSDKLDTHAAMLDTIQAKIEASHQAHQNLMSAVQAQQAHQLNSQKVQQDHARGVADLHLQAVQQDTDAAQNQQQLDQQAQQAQQPEGGSSGEGGEADQGSGQ